MLVFLPGVVAVLEFLPEVVIVLGQGPVLQVIVQTAVLVSCWHRLHYHRPPAPLPSASKSLLPSLERPGWLTQPSHTDRGSHQSFVILSCSPVAGSETAAQADCEEDEDHGEDDVAGFAEEAGADQPAVDVLDAGVLPLVRTEVETGLDGQVDPEETVSQHRVSSGIYVEITCTVISYHRASSRITVILPS